MKRRIDAIVLAGTQNYPKLDVDGGSEYKQFLKLGGQPILQYVVDAALGCEEIHRVYVVSDVSRVYKELSEQSTNDWRLTPTHDHGSYVENIRATFFREVLPIAGHKKYLHFCSDEQRKDYSAQYGRFNARRYHKQYLRDNPGAADQEVLILYSDMPFVTSQDITRFLALRDRKADLNVGFVTAESMSALESAVGASLSRPELKTGMLPLGDTKIRFNNLFTLKPLKAAPGLWSVIQEFYNNRYVLRKTGKTNRKNRKSLRREVIRYSVSNLLRRPYMLESCLLGLKYFNTMLATHQGNGEHPVPSKEDFEDVIADLADITPRAIMCDIVHPLLDIDNEEMYTLLKSNDEALFKKILQVKRDYEPLPEQVLDSFVKIHEYYFQGKPIDRIALEGPVVRLLKKARNVQFSAQKS
ncbi:NTP transferase domain-containing protein [Nanoarchaeota archaeon]